MRGFGTRRGWLAVVPLVLCSVVHRAQAQPAADATRQYAAATALQKRGAFGQAAAEWQKFIAGYKSDERIAKAHHYLGVCYYEEGKYGEALAVFEKTAAAYPQSDLLPATQLYLGATEFALARAGRQEMYPRAVETLRALVARHPQGEHVPDALFYLGECLYAQGKKAEAAAQYSRLVDGYPRHKSVPDALYALGVAQEESGDRPAAIESYQKFLDRFRDHRLAAEVAFRLGEALLGEGRQAEGETQLAAAASRSDFAMADLAALRRADAALQQRQYRRAADLYADLAARFPKSQHVPRALVSAGRCLYLAGQYADAQKPLAKAAELGGAGAAEAAHWLARSLIKQKRPGDAEAVVVKSLAGASGGPWAAQLLLDRADAVYEVPVRRKESVALYAAVAEKYPNQPGAPQALYMAAFTALELGDWASALAHARRFLAAHAGHELAPDALHVAAESILQSGKPADAEALFRQLVRDYPAHANAELWKVRLGVALHAQKKHEDTIRALEPILGELRSPERAAEARYLIGSSQLELKQYEAAAKSLSGSLEAQPTWRQADETWLALAEAYRGAGDLGQAKAAAAQAIERFPQSPLLDRAWYRLGTYRTLAGDTGAAAEAYRKVVDQWPKSPFALQALHELGCAQLSQKNAAAAEATFNTLLERHPAPPLAARARHARAMARQQQGKFAAALEDLQAVLAAQPGRQEKSDARFLAGICHAELKHYDEAAALLRALLDDDPKYAQADKALHQLGRVLKLAGREAEAAKALTRLADEFPQSPMAGEAQFSVGQSRLQAKDYAAAATAFYDVLKKAEKTPLGEQATSKLALCYFRQGNFADAQKTAAYQLAVYTDGPLAPDAALMAAECLREQGMFAEALAAYAQLKPSPNRETQAAILLHAGQAAAQLKRWSESAEWLGRAVRECPDSPRMAEILCELGWARQNLGQPDDAAAAYQQAIAKTDREPAARAQFLIGKIQSEANNPKEAVKSFFKVLYGYSAPKWQAEAAFEAGRALEAAGDKPQAAKAYQELLDKFPQSDKVPPAKQRLAALKAGG